MPTAYAAHDVYPVEKAWTDPETGHRWVHLSLVSPFDYEQVKALPRVLKYEGTLYTRTGWNSDRGEVYYRDNMPGADAVDLALRNVRAMMDTPVGRRRYASEFEQDVLKSVLEALKVLGEERS